jgi:hypothetical protein
MKLVPFKSVAGALRVAAGVAAVCATLMSGEAWCQSQGQAQRWHKTLEELKGLSVNDPLPSLARRGMPVRLVHGYGYRLSSNGIEIPATLFSVPQCRMSPAGRDIDCADHTQSPDAAALVAVLALTKHPDRRGKALPAALMLAPPGAAHGAEGGDLKTLTPANAGGPLTADKFFWITIDRQQDRRLAPVGIAFCLDECDTSGPLYTLNEAQSGDVGPVVTTGEAAPRPQAPAGTPGGVGVPPPGVTPPVMTAAGRGNTGAPAQTPAPEIIVTVHDVPPEYTDKVLFRLVLSAVRMRSGASLAEITGIRSVSVPPDPGTNRQKVVVLTMKDGAAVDTVGAEHGICGQNCDINLSLHPRYVDSKAGSDPHFFAVMRRNDPDSLDLFYKRLNVHYGVEIPKLPSRQPGVSLVYLPDDSLFLITFKAGRAQAEAFTEIPRWDNGTRNVLRLSVPPPPLGPSLTATDDPALPPPGVTNVANATPGVTPPATANPAQTPPRATATPAPPGPNAPAVPPQPAPPPGPATTNPAAVAPGPVAPNPAGPGPVAPGPVAPGPVAPGQVAPGPVAPGPVAPGPVAPGPVAPAPVAPGQQTAVAPNTPAPATPPPAQGNGIPPPGVTAIVTQPSPPPQAPPSPPPAPAQPAVPLHYVLKAAEPRPDGWSSIRLAKRLLDILRASATQFSLKDGDFSRPPQLELTTMEDAVIAWSGTRPQGTPEWVPSRPVEGVKFSAAAPAQPAPPPAGRPGGQGPRIRPNDPVAVSEFTIETPFLYERWQVSIDAVRKVNGQEMPDSSNELCSFSLTFTGSNERIKLTPAEQGGKRILQSDPLSSQKFASLFRLPAQFEVQNNDANATCAPQHGDLGAFETWKSSDHPADRALGRIEVRVSLGIRGRWLLGLFGPQSIGAGLDDASATKVSDAKDDIINSLIKFLGSVREQRFQYTQPMKAAIGYDLALMSSADAASRGFAEPSVLAGGYRQPKTNDFELDREGNKRLDDFLQGPHCCGSAADLQQVGERISRYSRLFGELSGESHPVAVYVGAAPSLRNLCSAWKEMTHDVASLSGGPRVFGIVFANTSAGQINEQLDHIGRGRDKALGLRVRALTCEGESGSMLLVVPFPDLVARPPETVLNAAFDIVQEWMALN